MKAIKYITLQLLLALPWMGHAQNEQDALNLSREEITGSARSIAMGGAFAALGADITGAYINPAGIAVFRANEFSISPSFHTNITNTSYYNTNTIGTNSNFNIATLGIVGVKSLRSNGNWRSSAIAFGLNRTFSFQRTYTAANEAVPSSLIDSYEKLLNERGIGPDAFGSNSPAYPFDIYLAWNNFLLDTLDDQGYYNASGEMPLNQSYRSEESGSKRSSFLSIGGNYDDKLYIGGNVIFSRIQYNRSFTHNEIINPQDSTTVLNEFSYNYSEKISGLGVALSIGAIYRPINNLRLGLSARTPTVYSLDIVYESSNTAVFADNLVFDTQSPYIGKYEFMLKSPLTATAGAAYTFGKSGLVSVDLDYVNYTDITMGGISDGYSFDKEEEKIQSQLTPTLNLRLGGEYRLDPNWSLRAGYAHFGNPYRSSVRNDGSFELYSAGFGYRNEAYFIDAAYQLKNSSDTKFLYDPELVEAAEITAADHRFTVTFGFKF